GAVEIEGRLSRLHAGRSRYVHRARRPTPWPLASRSEAGSTAGAPGRPTGLAVAPQSVPHLLAVVAAHDRVGDLVDALLERALQARLPFGRVGGLALGLHVPDDVGERAGQRQDPADRVGPVGADQAVGILAGGEREEAQALAWPQERQCPVGSTLGGAAAGVVAVEAEIGLVGELPELAKLALGQRRAEWGNGA